MDFTDCPALSVAMQGLMVCIWGGVFAAVSLWKAGSDYGVIMKALSTCFSRKRSCMAHLSVNLSHY
jgi:hypothetical protein